MIRLEISNDEKILLKSRKDNLHAIGYLAIIAISCLFFLYNAIHTCESLFVGLVSFNSNTNYVITAGCFLLVIPFDLFLVMDCFIPDIVLTDKKIYMRILFGWYIVALDEHIVAFLHYYEQCYRVSHYYKICLYFDNGGRSLIAH